jgi:hypothetical protein
MFSTNANAGCVQLPKPPAQTPESAVGRAVMRTWLTQLADEEGRPTDIDVDVA